MEPNLSALADDLEKLIGDNEETQTVTNWLDTGDPELNFAISGRYDGGIPYGRIVEMYGPPSSGKTAEATDLMIRAQEAGGIAMFFDWERSFDINLAKNLGLKTERPFWIYKKPETWEEGNVLAMRAVELIRNSATIPDDAPIICVFDSVASAIPQSVYYDNKGKKREIDTFNMSDNTALARASSTSLKVIAQTAEKYNATFLYLNQQRTKIGVMFGDPTTTPGGSSFEYYASVRIALGRTKLMETVNGKKQFVGQDIATKIVKTKLTKPFQETTMRMWFDKNGVAFFDRHYNLIEFLKAKGILKQSGAYIEWTDGKKYHLKSLCDKLKADPTGLQQLRALIPKISPSADDIEVTPLMSNEDELEALYSDDAC